MPTLSSKLYCLREPDGILNDLCLGRSEDEVKTLAFAQVMGEDDYYAGDVEGTWRRLKKIGYKIVPVEIKEKGDGNA